MRFSLTSGLGVALVLGNLVSSAKAAPVPPTYHVAATWKLAGEGGWDYLTLDSRAEFSRSETN